MTKELEGLETSPRVEIHIYWLKTKLKKYQTGKLQAKMEPWFLFQEIHPHSRQTRTKNKQMLTWSTSTRMTKGKTTLIKKDPKKRNRSKQLQTYNRHADDVENIESADKERHLQLVNKPWFVPWGREKMSQKIQRHRRPTLHEWIHPKWEQDQKKKTSYGRD